MGAQKKFLSLVGMVFSFLFLIFFSCLLLLQGLDFSEKGKIKIKDLGILSGCVFFFCFFFILWIYLLCITFNKEVKIILKWKHKPAKITINNTIQEKNNFIKRTEYQFTKTTIRRKGFSDKKIKKIITSIVILNNNKILLGFSEGTIMLCLIENNYELKQIFSFNKYKEKKVIDICQSLKYKNEFMISINSKHKPLKLIKLNLDYKYSLIKELARDKAYLVLKKYGNKKWKYIFKIIPYQNGQFLIVDRKGIYLKEKINPFNYDENELEYDEYEITQEYMLNSESNEEIYDVIKINEDSFITLERKNNTSNLHFYKMNNLRREINYISNIITSQSLSNRLCYINQFLISVFDTNEIIIVNTQLKQKVNSIKIDNIQNSLSAPFNDGSLLCFKNNLINGSNVPFIVKLKILNEREHEIRSITNTLQDYKNEEEMIGNKITVMKCLENKGILIYGNSQGKLFIWEEIDNINNIKINNLY